jgi:hypothetical protein
MLPTQGEIMLDDMETKTLLGVLEYGGLVAIERGVAHTTPRFNATLEVCQAARRKGRHAKRNADLREPISAAMFTLYGQYLCESELCALVDAMLPIASAERKPER